MRIIRRFYMIAAATIMVVSALLKLAMGALMMSVSVWLAYQGRESGLLVVIMAAFLVWGFVIFVRALGPLVGESAPGRRRV